MTSSFSVDDLITKRLTIDGQRIQQLDLGALVVSDPTYGIGIGTDTPRLRLDISGTNGIRIPVGTTGERPQIGVNDIVDLSGVLRYNTTLNQYEAWALDGWQAFGGSSLQLYTKEQGTNPTIKLTKEITTYGGNNDGGIIEFCLKNQSNSVTYQARISALDSTSNAGYGSLVFSTSGGGNPQERMRIDHTGNVDISDNLTVGGDISGNDASFNDVSGVNFFGGNFFGNLQGNAATVTNGVYTTGTQNIGGLKTFTSNTKIETNNDPNLQISNTTTGAGYMYLQKNNDGNAYVLNNSNHDLILGANNNLSQLVLKNDGNVGIGTSPDEKLEVVDGNICIKKSFSSVLNQTIGAIMFKHNMGGIKGKLCEIAAVGDSTGSVGSGTAYSQSGRLEFKTLASTNGSSSSSFVPTTKMTIDSNGNVGIGTYNPKAKLNVAGKITSTDNTIPSNYGGNVTTTCTFGHGNGNSDDYFGLNIGTLWNESSYIQVCKNSSVTSNHKLLLNPNGGNVGIGTSSPSYPLEIYGNYNGAFNHGQSVTLYGVSLPNYNSTHTWSGTWYTNFYGFPTISLKTQNGIYCGGQLFITSDERIKTNIRDVSDNVALQQLRDISCCFYEYKDKVKRGTDKTIGFIAQQVREHMPMAVSIQKGIIPNEMRKIENPQWTTLTDASGNNTYKLTIPDLEDASGNTSETTKYRFYVSNDPSGNDECEKEITSLENDPKSFIFQEQWQNVFLYGKEIDDFHTLDKQKLFALNFSATQEIDRIQQQEKVKLEEQTSKLEEQTSKLEEQTSKLEAAEAEIIALKSKNQDLETKLEEQTTKLTNLIDQLKANNTIN